MGPLETPPVLVINAIIFMFPFSTLTAGWCVSRNQAKFGQNLPSRQNFFFRKSKVISSVAKPGNRPAAWQAAFITAHAVEAVPDAVRNVECPVFSMRHLLLVAKNCLCDDSSWGADSGQPLFPEIFVNGYILLVF